MKLSSLILVLILFFVGTNFAYAGLFSMNKPLQKSSEPGQEIKEEEIPIIDTADKSLIKRRAQAHKLIVEGRELIQKGEKKDNQKLIVKGKIKKEIGEKQLRLIREQIENKKAQDKNDNW